MKRKVIPIALLASTLAICFSKQQIVLWIASNFGWNYNSIETAVGPPHFKIDHHQATALLQQLSHQERSVLKIPTLQLWESIAADPGRSAVGYLTGDSVRWLLINRNGQIHSEHSLPAPHNENC
jgi:hypothetical protein